VKLKDVQQCGTPTVVDVYFFLFYSIAVFNSAVMAKEALYRPGELSDETKTTLSGLAQHEDLDSMMAFLNKMKDARGGVRASVASAVRPAEGMELAAQRYEAAIRAYETFGIIKDMPSWAEITATLSPKETALIERLPDVRVLLSGGLRHELVAAIDKKVGHHGITKKTYTYRLDDDQLWSNGEAETVNKRQVVFVDGRQDVPYNEALQAGKTNLQQVVALTADYKGQGLDVLSGAQDYLGLQIQALAGGKLIDKGSSIVLNANVVAEDAKAFLGLGLWSYGRLCLSYGYPYNRSNLLRVRGAVRVNL